MCIYPATLQHEILKLFRKCLFRVWSCFHLVLLLIRAVCLFIAESRLIHYYYAKPLVYIRFYPLIIWIFTWMYNILPPLQYHYHTEFHCPESPCAPLIHPFFQTPGNHWYFYCLCNFHSQVLSVVIFLNPLILPAQINQSWIENIYFKIEPHASYFSCPYSLNNEV